MAITKWKHLQIADLRKILSNDEAEKLDTLSLGVDQTAAINDAIDLIADVWRGALSAKGYILDVRDHYTPPEYAYYILVHARHAVWTRFPNSGNIALDNPREDEYNKALKILDDPKISPSLPDYSDDPVLAGDDALLNKKDAAIIVPNMRIHTWNPIWSRDSASTSDISGRDIFCPLYPETLPN